MADAPNTTLLDEPKAPEPSGVEAGIAAVRAATPAEDPWEQPVDETLDADEDGAPLVELPPGDPWEEARKADEAKAAAKLQPPAAKPVAGAASDEAEGEGGDETDAAAEAIAAEAAAAAAAGTPLAAPVTLVLPTFDAADEDTEPVEIDTDDPVLVTRFNELVTRATEADAVIEDSRASASRAYADRDDFLVALRTDPVGTILKSLATPAAREAFALQVLQDDAIRQAVLPTLEKWDEDPREKELAASRYREQTTSRKEAADQWRAEQTFIRSWNDNAFDQVAKLVPRGLDQATRALCIRDATADIQAAITANNGEYIDPGTIPTVLAKRVELWRGIAPVRSPKKGGPAKPGAATTVAKPAATAAPPKAKPAAAPSAAELEAARTTPDRIKRATLRRRTMAASAPATRAAAPVVAAPAADVSKMNTKEAIAALRGKPAGK